MTLPPQTTSTTAMGQPGRRLDAPKGQFHIHLAALGVVFFTGGAFSLASGEHGLNGLIPMAMALALQPFARSLSRFWFGNLADEVVDLGDRLFVRIGTRSAVVHLSNVRHVKFAGLVDPCRIVLTLLEPEEFGLTVTFHPRGDGRLSNPIADDLQQRVLLAARERRA